MSRNIFIADTSLDIDEEILEDSYDSDLGEEELELPMDLIQTPGFLIAKVPIAGAGINDIDISLNTDKLTIKKRVTFDATEKVVRMHLEECYWGELGRTVELPKPVDPDHTKATLDDGILTIRMPLAGRLNTRVIKIKE